MSKIRAFFNSSNIGVALASNWREIATVALLCLALTFGVDVVAWVSVRTGFDLFHLVDWLRFMAGFATLLMVAWLGMAVTFPGTIGRFAGDSDFDKAWQELGADPSDQDVRRRRRQFLCATTVFLVLVLAGALLMSGHPITPPAASPVQP